MSLFKSKAEKELDRIILKLEMNMSNNYKDNAVENIKKLRQLLDLRSMDGALKPELMDEYRKTLEGFEEDVRSFKRTY